MCKNILGCVQLPLFFVVEFETPSGTLKIPNKDDLATAEVLNFLNNLFNSCNGKAEGLNSSSVGSNSSPHKPFNMKAKDINK